MWFVCGVCVVRLVYSVLLCYVGCIVVCFVLWMSVYSCVLIGVGVLKCLVSCMILLLIYLIFVVWCVVRLLDIDDCVSGLIVSMWLLIM